jgi:hypothetical protein
MTCRQTIERDSTKHLTSSSQTESNKKKDLLFLKERQKECGAKFIDKYSQRSLTGGGARAREEI